MKPGNLFIIVLLAAACDGTPSGVTAGFTEPLGTPGGSTSGRGFTLRGLVTGPTAERIPGATVRVTTLAVDSLGVCSRQVGQVSTTTSAAGEFRSDLRTTADVVDACLTVLVTPSTGSTLRASTVDGGRIRPGLLSGTLPELQLNVQLVAN